MLLLRDEASVFRISELGKGGEGSRYCDTCDDGRLMGRTSMSFMVSVLAPLPPPPPSLTTSVASTAADVGANCSPFPPSIGTTNISFVPRGKACPIRRETLNR